MTKEEKDKQEQPFLYATIDGRKERVGNFRVEPPGLFRGRGEHPKMGRLKKRILPKDVIVNLGEKAPVPPSPIPGHKWGEVYLFAPLASPFSRALNLSCTHADYTHLQLSVPGVRTNSALVALGFELANRAHATRGSTAQAIGTEGPYHLVVSVSVSTRLSLFFPLGEELSGVCGLRAGDPQPHGDVAGRLEG